MEQMLGQGFLAVFFIEEEKSGCEAVTSANQAPWTDSVSLCGTGQFKEHFISSNLRGQTFESTYIII